MAACTETALAPAHVPVNLMFGSWADPEGPVFVDVCEVCGTTWPCLIAELSGLPGARMEPIDWPAYLGPFDEEPPF